MALFVEERRRIILEQLLKSGRVSVKDLSDEMGVSAVTIRQDLRVLEEEGRLERTYGGAVRRESLFPELSFHQRIQKKRASKEAMALAAVSHIRDGSSIAIDGSTTVFAMVPHLKKFSKLTIITNSLMTAQQFLDTPHITVLLPGGRLRRDSISIVGRPDSLPDVNLNLGYFGARGVSMLGEVSDVDADECSIKQAMQSRCLETVIMADGTKWGQVAPYTFTRFASVSRFITTDDAPEDLVQQVRAVGPLVDVVKVHRR